MSDEILYNFAANASSIDDINSSISAVNEVKDDIAKVFTALSVAYEGQGASALQQAHNDLNNMLDDALNNSSNTQKFAQDQQEAMQALDQANASAF